MWLCQKVHCYCQTPFSNVSSVICVISSGTLNLNPFSLCLCVCHPCCWPPPTGGRLLLYLSVCCCMHMHVLVYWCAWWKHFLTSLPSASSYHFLCFQLDLVSVAKVKIILSVLCNEINWFNTWHVCLCVCVCVSMSACLFLCLSTSVCICLSVYLPVCVSVRLSAAVSARITQRRDCPGVVCQVVRRPVGYVDVVILRWSTPTDATYSQRPWHWRQTHSSTRQQVTCLPWTYVSRPCVVKRLTSGQQGVDAV